MNMELYCFVKRLAYLLPDPIIVRLRFFWKHRYWPNLITPRSLTEKILWLMMWDSNPLRAEVVDRIKARDFVHKRTPSCKFPEHLWVGDYLTLDIWNGLPSTFVLKANHGSQMTCIVDKQQHTLDEIVALSEKWLAKNYFLDFGEWVYLGLPKVLIAEQKLDVTGNVPPDWKFFCGNGKVFLVEFISDRFGCFGENYYLPDFTLLCDVSMGYAKGPDINEPACFKDAIRIAEQLSATFDFIRVDLYLTDQDVYFGEMTCFPSAGLDSIKPIKYDFEFGAQVELDKSFVNLVPIPIWVKSSLKNLYDDCYNCY